MEEIISYEERYRKYKQELDGAIVILWFGISSLMK